jgi:hypothetical protein
VALPNVLGESLYGKICRRLRRLGTTGHSPWDSARIERMSQVQRRNPCHVRLLCSILAITICWGIAGFVFVLTVKGPGTLAAWLIWGGGFCLVGWLVVGIPLVAAGDQIYRLRPVVLAIGVGLCGVLIMSLPGLAGVLTHDFGAQGKMVIALGSTFWEFQGSAFAIAAAAALLYRGLLIKSQANALGSQRST